MEASKGKKGCQQTMGSQGEARRIPLQVSEEAWLCKHLDLELPACRTVRTHSYCFKPPSCWYFVTIALKN
jgi:hypothetical protein